MLTDTSWVSVMVVYMAEDDRARMRTLRADRYWLARSQRDWMRLSAPCALMVSMPVRLSTRVALRCAEAW